VEILHAKGLFYLSRAWTYLYFVPQIFRFMTLPVDVPLSPKVATSVLKWVTLSWIRCAIDGVTAILFLRSVCAPENLD